eukprot:TRINITY_DN10343_c0_g1_i1.p1 TRINITY_DN10343_c0_g1~~TRINITY_DN10343_c0_g1_i1.p1  ORF type:complete len:463 (-),score=80.68 TRINITY_DN10343_c0_g1_i1:563-1951(-)
MNISFAGCGFMGIYHVGVSACLQTYAPFMLENKVAGASAGSLAAAALIGNVPLADMVRECVQLSCLASEKILGPFNPNFNINVSIKEALNRVLPDDIHIRASAKLYISMTRFSDGSNWIVSDFDSKDDVINAILGSSFIPLFSGFFLPKFRGVTVLDGGYSDNVPTFLGTTITVSPFHGNQDICPEDDAEMAHLLGFKLPTGPDTNITLSAENMERLGKSMIPPKIEDMIILCRQGFQDAFRFLRSRNIIQCEECRNTKLKARYTRIDEWRKRSDETCEGCQNLPQSIQSVELPQELLAVFNNELEQQKTRTGNMTAQVAKDETIGSSANEESHATNDAISDQPPPVATTSKDDGHTTATASSEDKTIHAMEKQQSTESAEVQTAVIAGQDSHVHVEDHNKSCVDVVSDKSKEVSAHECSKATSDAANVSGELSQKEPEDVKEVVDAETKDETVIVDKDKSS